MSGAARKIELGVLTERSSPQVLFDYACELEGMVKTLSEPTSDGKVENLQRQFKLTLLEAKLLATLADGRIHSKVNLISALYWDRIDDAPEVKIIDVFVCKLRHKLAGSGIVIETAWGTGYSVQDVAPLAAAMAGEAPTQSDAVQPDLTRRPGTFGRRYGIIRDTAMNYLRTRADEKGVVIVSSRELSSQAGLSGAGSVTIRNLERTGQLRVVKAAARRGNNEPDNWVLALARAA